MAILRGILGDLLGEATNVVDDLITDDSAENVIDTLDKIENHALLKDKNAFIITKFNDGIKVIHIKRDSLKMLEKPTIVPIQDVLDVIREKAENRLDEMEQRDINENNDQQE